MSFMRTFKDMVNIPVDDSFILVDDGLPINNDDVEVIGRNYIWSHNKLGKAKFDPKSGWSGDCEIVFAWKPLTNQIKKIMKDNPEKK